MKKYERILRFLRLHERDGGGYAICHLGWSQVFVMQPFEIIKVRLQTQPENAKIYTGIVDCLKQIIAKEGPLALYKGSLTPLMGVGLLGSARFGFYEFGQKKMSDIKSIPVTQLSLFDKTLCGLFAGFLNSFQLVHNI